ncbi:MAG TPA: hypothetical protein VK797_26505 [Tepidisphaeraceae bacterium]|nr:hypothetical protein [Tepidisphaeraceae bacterium]
MGSELSVTQSACLIENDSSKRGSWLYPVISTIVCTPWSRNCRNCVYFDNIVLDAESLKSRSELPNFVAVHFHRGTHDGAEQGLVCQLDHDALIGAHPEVAKSSRLIG